MRAWAHAILNPPELRGSAHSATIRKKRTIHASIAPRTRIARTYSAITIERARRSKARLRKYGKIGKVLTSQPQPEPWMEAVVALNSLMKASTEPQFCSMADLRGPALMAPPLPLPSDLAGARFFQKSEWLMCPADMRAPPAAG